MNNLIKYIDLFVEENEVIKSKFYYQDTLDYDLVNLVERIINTVDRILAENKKFSTRKAVLDCYFELRQFVKISDYYDKDFKYIVEVVDEDISISLNCFGSKRTA